MIDRRRIQTSVSVALFVFVTVAGFASAQEESLKPGINEGYKNPDVQRSIKRFEGEKRDVVRKRDEIVAACGLKAGMVVADVGVGTGLFTWEFAARVGAEGRVYAVDIAESFVEHIEKTCKENDVDNVIGIVSTPTSAKLPPESTDLVFICDTYHHFEYPFRMLDSIHEALRSNGRLIIIDRKSASDHVRADQATVRKEVTAAGFKFLEETDVSDRGYLMHFQKNERGAAADSGSARSL